MSAILRNTLRFVGTTNCATNNSTKYLQTMPHMANRLNDLLALNGPNYLHHHESKRLQHTRGSNKEWTYFEKTSNVGHFFVSLNSGKIRLLTDELFGRKKSVTWPCTFNTKLNGKTIVPETNERGGQEENISFDIGKLNVSFDDGKVKLQRQDNGKSFILPFTISTDLNGKNIRLKSIEEETPFNFGKLKVLRFDGGIQIIITDTGDSFVLSHAFHVEAHNKPPKTLNDDSIKALSPMKFSSSHLCDAKITSKTELGEFPTSYPETQNELTLCKQAFENKILKNEYGANDELTVAPNKNGKMKLQFPMDVSFEGARQVIKIENSDDILTFYHTVDIKACNNGHNGKYDFKNRTSKIGKFAIQLESGDLLIESREPSDKRINMKQEVRIVVDLDSAVPSICVDPYVKAYSEYCYYD